MDSDEELEAYKDLIAGSSSEDNQQEGSECEDDKQKHIEAMRAKLLGGLDSMTDPYKKNKDLQQGSDDDSMDVQFNVGFGEDIGQKLMTEKKEKKEKAQMSDFQKWQERKAEKRKEKKRAQKQAMKDKKLQGKMTEAEVIAHNKEKAQLELLLESQKQPVVASKVVDHQNDNRFRTNEKDFAVDPTHKEYKKIKQGHNKIAKTGSGQHVHSRK